MKKVLIIIVIIAVVIIGGVEIGVTMQKSKTSSQNAKQEEKVEENIDEGFIFNDGNIKLVPGSVFSKETLGLGDEKNYSEIASCAFEGLDKTYTYENYEITTFPDGDQDKIYTIYLLNDQVQTAEGLKITDEKDKMISTYGEDYKTQGNQYTYTKGKTNLEIIVENDVVTSIQYSYVTE